MSESRLCGNVNVLTSAVHGWGEGDLDDAEADSGLESCSLGCPEKPVGRLITILNDGACSGIDGLGVLLSRMIEGSWNASSEVFRLCLRCHVQELPGLGEAWPLEWSSLLVWSPLTSLLHPRRCNDLLREGDVTSGFKY